MELSLSISGRKPCFVQQLSGEAWLGLVATEMGRGGILTTSTSSLPMMHMLAPLSTMQGWADALKASTMNPTRLTCACMVLLPWRPKVHGKPTTCCTPSKSIRGQANLSVIGVLGVACVDGNRNLNGVVGGDGRMRRVGSDGEPGAK